jgi:hypothetical protein
MRERPLIDEVLKGLHGNPETFRKILLDKDAILARVCRYAERVAKRKRVEPWLIIGDITSHGSGVSNAIYQLYRDRQDGDD